MFLLIFTHIIPIIPKYSKLFHLELSTSYCINKLIDYLSSTNKTYIKNIKNKKMEIIPCS